MVSAEEEVPFPCRQALADLTGTRHYIGEVRACGKLSSEFSISNGVRQGDVLAPTLFNLFLDAVLCKALEDHPGCGLSILYNQEAELVEAAGNSCKTWSMQMTWL